MTADVYRSDNCTATSLNSSTISIPEEKLQSARQVLDLERETLELRRELQDTRNKKEEADQKVFRLVCDWSKKKNIDSQSNTIVRLSNMLRRSEPPEDSVSTLTTSSVGPRVVLSGPVTSL